MNDHNSSQVGSRRLDQEAARWLVRCARGLTAPEEEEYLRWLRDDPRHAAAASRQAAVIMQLRQLADFAPPTGARPNPDLFAPRGRTWFGARPWSVLMAAAAAMIMILARWQLTRQLEKYSSPATFLVINERQRLPDSSVVELKEGSRISVRFSATERRVKLIGDEAQFMVAHNAERPFIVQADGVQVRAVGTAFDIRCDEDFVKVIVSEGSVQVDHDAASRTAATAPQITVVHAGQHATVSRKADEAQPQVRDLTETEIRQALDWAAPRLQFHETPLIMAIAEFNRHNERKMVLADPTVGQLLIGGTFRVDNIDGFMRSLHIAFHLRADPRGSDKIVLTQEP